MAGLFSLRTGNRVPMFLWICLVVCLLIASCTSGKSTPALPRSMAVIVSCDTAGWIVPCGCSSKQAGGLLRRASYVNEIRKSSDVLLADAGGAPGGSSDYDRSKFEYVLRGEVAMQTAAHNIGAAEAELGAETLRKLAESTQAPLISTNVTDLQGKPFVPSHRIVTLGKHRIGVAGVLSQKYAQSGLKIGDPHEALMRLTQELKGQFDSMLVLAYVPEEELAALAGRLPEADMVVGGPTRQSITPRKAGPTIWGATTNKGKFLVHLEKPPSNSAWEGKVVELSPEFPDESTQVANLQRFRDELARVDFSASQTSFAPAVAGETPEGFFVVGTDECQKCHQDDCQIWSESRHANAWKTLVDKKSNIDPYCQHCHTTGYGLPGGFQSMALGGMRHNVGCESCHGPSKAHSIRPATRTIYNARDRCIVCHDHENSPQFDAGKFWDQIAHGRTPSVPKEE